MDPRRDRGCGHSPSRYARSAKILSIPALEQLRLGAERYEAFRKAYPFRISGLSAKDRPRRFKGYTTFSSPSPFIAIPHSTVAMRWRDGPRGQSGWGMPDIVQFIDVLEIKYRKATPP